MCLHLEYSRCIVLFHYSLISAFEDERFSRGEGNCHGQYFKFIITYPFSSILSNVVCKNAGKTSGQALLE